MWPVAIFLMLVVAFYWGAIYLSVVAWINAIGHLLRGNFIRASIWLSIGCGMLFWWQGTEVIPHPWDVEKWLQGSAVIVGRGALATLARFYHEHQQATQAAAPPEATPIQVTFNIEVGADPPVAEPTPRRRLPRPTIIDH